MHFNIGIAFNPNFVSSLFIEYFFKYAFSSITPIVLNLQNKSPKIFDFDIFGLKCYMPC